MPSFAASCVGVACGTGWPGCARAWVSRRRPPRIRASSGDNDMYYYWNTGSWDDFADSFNLVWLFSESIQGAADFHELMRTARHIRPGNVDDWYSGFGRIGDHVKRLADQAAAGGHDTTASECYLRAFSYYRAAELRLPGKDARKLPMYYRAIACWQAGITRSPQPHEDVKIAFDGIELAGHFFAPRARIFRDPPPCIVFLSGADALPEENFFRGVQYITARGVACLVFNGPGQGSTIRLLNRPTIPDYERPVSAAVDYLMTRRDIDHDRIGLLGVSMAGYYAPRAACFEHRFKACVAWGGLYNILEDLYLYYPPIRKQLQWIGGCQSDEEARAYYAKFTLQGLLPRIRCPVLITHGIWDTKVPLSSAQRTFDELAVKDKELRLYDDVEGGAEHCNIENWVQVIPYQVDWLIDRLR
ncbi:MAG: alpha/beta hydrolase [Alphaproteobacteria bacterium]|nr:alpha/beta hydrolase [Alphaproteobacteria bacterium]